MIKHLSIKKFCVWLCWKGWRPPSTHWRGPTTDSHGDSWLLSFPPGPVRPSLVNLTPPGSPGGSMLMQALVRTPDQHDPVTTRTPLLKSSLRTCLPVAGLQELATTPGNGKSRSGGCSRNLSAFVQSGVSELSTPSLTPSERVRRKPASVMEGATDWE